jgi:hypothetical protein
MFLPALSSGLTLYDKHKITVYSVSEKNEIAIFNIVLIKVLIKYDKVEYADYP